MSTVSKNSLESALQQLECHFTWSLMKEDVDLNDLEEKIGYEIEFFIKSKIRSYNLLSYVCHLKNSNEEALRTLQKAEEEVKKYHPDEIARRSLVTWANYAWIYYHMERYEEAQTYVSKVENSCKNLSSTPHWKAQLPEICAEEGWALIKFGEKQYERANTCFKNALQNEPNNPEFNAGYAITMYRSNYHFKSQGPSLKLLKRAVELDPENTSVVALLAIQLQDLSQTDEGERYIEEAMKKTPDHPHVLRYAAKFYRRKGELDKAVKILKKALTVTPNSATLLHQLGLCYRLELIQLKAAKRYPPQEQVDRLIELCIFHFKSAIDKKTTFFHSYMDLANMYAEGKRYKEAEDTFQRAFQLNNLSNNNKQQLYYCYGNFKHFNVKKESEAIEHYIDGMKIEGDPFYFNKCKNALEKLLEKRIQRGSRDPADFGRLGLVHNLSGEKQQAIQRYEEALELHPDNEDYLSTLRELQLSISN
ncbi:interferon-induced protein with tetratricopeptide repeats 5-like [Melanerpes formicivorus]|uniref:interferon-induced protein with tetratricopeptide repeats 5-like n=1 Tax=Melanerpes formicivorus TaxID=211600 RepID=UPI00358E27DB